MYLRKICGKQEFKHNVQLRNEVFCCIMVYMNFLVLAEGLPAATIILFIGRLRGAGL